MIAEVILTNYDVQGTRTAATTAKNRRFFHRSFPMGRYVTRPLLKQCSNIREMRQFLRQCKFVTDREQFGKSDYWMPPEEFEQKKAGDCDDFALWAWRQLMGMGYKARYVVGAAGAEGHAWVTIEKDGKHFIVDPTAWMFGERLPRLHFISYEPHGSVEWDGQYLRYYRHEKPGSGISIPNLAALVGEWLWFWVRFLGNIFLLPLRLLRNYVPEHLPVGRP